MTSVTKGLRRSVVVFSKNYLPLSRVNMKRAETLLVTGKAAGKAEPLDWCNGQDYPVHSPSLVLLVPKQTRLTKANTDRLGKVPPVNRREVLRRDKHRCQYCGSTKRLTLDHVIPRSKGGNHPWDNVVTA